MIRHEKQDACRMTSNRSNATSGSHRDNPRRLLAPKRLVQLPYELIRHRAKHEKHGDQEGENETPDGPIFGIAAVPLVIRTGVAACRFSGGRRVCCQSSGSKSPPLVKRIPGFPGRARFFVRGAIRYRFHGRCWVQCDTIR